MHTQNLGAQTLFSAPLQRITPVLLHWHLIQQNLVQHNDKSHLHTMGTSFFAIRNRSWWSQEGA